MVDEHQLTGWVTIDTLKILDTAVETSRSQFVQRHPVVPSSACTCLVSMVMAHHPSATHHHRTGAESRPS